ncbi:hypothetical protein B0T16DRAFT_348400 [Cercophora newfieldiana]|uniref:Amine oxidase domain-containing protein n=1 Tax=Cercophora newfieldiana TaxID=92897 RepID=A0AA39Y935_9PEZI|nr:hypothetical protein B0T16DRAFT_348400 [Cercophora newfieldiana]
MSVVTDTMAACLSSTEWPKPGSASINVALNTPVVAMALAHDGSSIQVTTGAGKTPPTTTPYDMVFNTTALGPLQRMDLSGLNLDRPILDGIRSLSYDRATKVAIKFNTRWWKSFYPDDASRNLGGGVSSSDLPISNVVYPSWDDGDGTNVLIVSYTWAQDAARMAALVPDYTDPSTPTPTYTDPIAAVCLQGLVTLWQGQVGAPTLAELQGYYVTHHAWAWSHDPWTSGAFALFGPGQFENVFPLVHHAWISGALDSALFAVLTFLGARATAGFPDMAVKAATLLASDFNPDKEVFGNGERSEHPERDERLAYWCAHAGAMK